LGGKIGEMGEMREMTGIRKYFLLNLPHLPFPTFLTLIGKRP
jgi:hypothetical protein